MSWCKNGLYDLVEIMTWRGREHVFLVIKMTETCVYENTSE
jgi:hypothetical protein